MNFIRILLLLPVMILTGCSSDSNTQTFPSTPEGFFSAGYSENYALSGASTSGSQFSGTLRLSTMAETPFNGIVSNPVSIQLELSNLDSGLTSSSGATYFYVVSDNIVSLTGITTQQGTLLPESFSVFPGSVKIGDFGSFGTFFDTDGNTFTSTWRIENAGSGNALIVNTENQRDANGEIIAITEQLTTIDAAGTRLRTEIRVNNPATGQTVTLQGERL